MVNGFYNQCNITNHIIFVLKLSTGLRCGIKNKIGKRKKCKHCVTCDAININEYLLYKAPP